MGSAALLDLDALIAPLSGDNPAGEPLPFALRKRLDEARKEINPDDFPADYPGRPEAKKADWDGILELCQDALRNSSKDLHIVSRLTEAIVKRHGFGGLRDALLLFCRLVEECWDRIYPSIEDGDLEVRAAPFLWLDDPARGARFPHSLRAVPVVSTSERGIGLFDWEQAREGRGTVTPEMFDKAVQQAPYERCHNLLADLDESQRNLQRLTEALNDKLGSAAPGLLDLRTALQQCQQLAQQILQRKGPPPRLAVEPAAVETPSNGAAPASPETRAVAAQGRPLTREDVYAQLLTSAEILEKMEPHSPIPILLRRVAELGPLSFTDLMGALVRDQLMGVLLRNPELQAQVNASVGAT